MQGYYEEENGGRESEVPTGRLYVEVTNMPEFQELIQKAKREADQLNKTIDRLSNFDLKIDFSVKDAIS